MRAVVRDQQSSGRSHHHGIRALDNDIVEAISIALRDDLPCRSPVCRAPEVIEPTLIHTFAVEGNDRSATNEAGQLPFLAIAWRALKREGCCQDQRHENVTIHVHLFTSDNDTGIHLMKPDLKAKSTENLGAFIIQYNNVFTCSRRCGAPCVRGVGRGEGVR
jgi:hypothetical protein